MSAHANIYFKSKLLWLLISSMTSLLVCPACSALLQNATRTQPHPQMQLMKVRSPAEYGGTLKRQYRCITCGAHWLRCTDSRGVEIHFELLP